MGCHRSNKQSVSALDMKVVFREGVGVGLMWMHIYGQQRGDVKLVGGRSLGPSRSAGACWGMANVVHCALVGSKSLKSFGAG